jgi:cysteine-rich repeat protein
VRPTLNVRRRPVRRSRIPAALAMVAAAVAVVACNEPSPPRVSVGGAGEGGSRDGESGRGTEGGAPSAGMDSGVAGAGGASEPVCGNGRREAGEACDDANTVDGDGCSSDCDEEATAPVCGDGDVEGSEACDDGDLEPGDGCDEECREEVCGNDRVDAREECDPPVEDECTGECLILRSRCGDGVVQSSDLEECDDGNADAGDGCYYCREECGDGRVEGQYGEECEPAYAPEACSDACRWLPVCGDGEVQSDTGEECDPSNGVTCVACRAVEPPPNPGCDGGAGGGSNGGQGGGCGGSDAVCTPTGVGQLLSNGTFDSNVGAWSAHSTLVTLAAADEGSPSPKSLELTFATGASRALSGAYQCVPVRPGVRYDFRGVYRVPAGSPAGVSASVTALLYAGSRCAGAFVPPAGSGPEGSVRDVWTPYEYRFDTSTLPEGTTDARLLLRLNVLRPANASGSRVLWDDVSLTELDGVCGNCVVDDGETCDDGNRTSGDGCSASCVRETCGDGVTASSEQCDDGNTTFGEAGDACTPSCRTPSACDVCVAGPDCLEETKACLGLTGVASAGPRAGTPLSVLCDELRACVTRSACHLAVRNSAGVEGAFFENCYCGVAGEDCFEDAELPNGSCRKEVEAALETRNPSTLLNRFSGGDARYPVFAAVRDLMECERSHCASDCPSASRCGDNSLQDRNLVYQFFIDGQEVDCRDELTHTGRGCSFEECDDGNTTAGDGCDEICFVEACGNNVVQVEAGETCDDGNTVAGDGCSATCTAEFDCGNGSVEAPFEQCDLGRTGNGTGKVCTLVEFEQAPEQCGCAADCQYFVCGDGRVQRPQETCDPPGGFGCGDDCRPAGVSPCEACIAAHPDLGPVNETYCNVSQECRDLKQCIEDSGCYLPTPASCYCGEDIDSCEDPGHVANGPCRDEVVAGLEGGTLDTSDNATVLEHFYDFDYPTGRATSILDEATRLCPDDCAL